jgi:hypothetical protein
MDKQGKRVVTTAIERQRALADKQGVEETDLYKRVGIQRENVLKQYKYVIEQTRDMSSKLKALSPLLKQEGIDLTNGGEQQQAPVINIVSMRTDGPTEPQKGEYKVLE